MTLPFTPVPFRSFVLGNVRGTKPYMSGDDVAEDFDELRDWGTAISLNEMWRYTRLLRQIFDSDQWHLLCKPGCSTAFALRKDRWNVLSAGWWPLHGAVAGPPWRRVISDAREIAQALVTWEESPAAKFRLMVIHQTPSAWYGTLPSRWRTPARAAWYEGRNNVRYRAENDLRNDIPVMIKGDWNYKDKPLGTTLLNQRVRHVTSTNGIDKFILIDSPSLEWVVEPDSVRIFNLNSDHDGMRARITLRRKVRRV